MGSEKKHLNKTVGLITARGGSKGIPQKNIIDLAGKPLIAWTIQAALQSRFLDRLIISTDDEEIANVSRTFGAEVPFLRPSELAEDNSSHLDVVIHAVEWLQEHENYYPDYVSILQPTSPLRTTEDIDAVIQLAIKQNAEGVISVCETHHHPYLMTRIAPDGTLVEFLTGSPESGTSSIRRQELPPVYFINGAIYLVMRKILLEKRTLQPERTFAYIMPNERSLQIDEPKDLFLVDLLLRDKLTNTTFLR